MEIVVCVKRVPDTAEEELSISRDGHGIEEKDLSYSCNEADLYAVEAALELKEKHGGQVILVTVGPEDSEEILRMELAKGADRAVHVIAEDSADLDGHAVASALAGAIRGIPHDLVLAGCVASDTGAAQVGGMLAEMLGHPHATLVTSLEVEGARVQVGRELEGGVLERLDLALPAVVLVQTGLNKPRYASILGIRKAGAKEVQEVELEDLEVSPAWTRVEAWSLPPQGKSAELLEGPPDKAAAALAQVLKGRGLL